MNVYISPFNYYPKFSLNTVTKQNKNPNFKSHSNKFIGAVGTATLIPAASVISKQLSSDTVQVNCAKTTTDNTTINSDATANIEYNATTLEHHPDFYALKKEGLEILASSYFRRGACYGSPSDEFVDVINSLKIFFNDNTLPSIKDNKVKMLVGGIGESQEPFSLLATIKYLIGKENINDVLDMYTVDLQGKPQKNTLFKQSFYSIWEPRFVKSSFVTDDATKYDLPEYKTYRVSDDIYEYLLNTYNNPEKSKWKSRIQDTLKEYPDEEFDIISINNTLGYIRNTNELADSVENIYRTLKPVGIFISDNRLRLYNKIFTPENSKEIYPGIFQKL